MNSSRAFAVLIFLSGAAAAGDWHYSVGVHDFTVPEVDSDTFGINGRRISIPLRKAAGS